MAAKEDNNINRIFPITCVCLCVCVSVCVSVRVRVRVCVRARGYLCVYASDYHHWIFPMIDVACKAIGASIAWFLFRVLAGLYAIDANARTHTYTRKRKRAQTRTHTQTHARERACARAHTHTHTQVRAGQRSGHVRW